MPTIETTPLSVLLPRNWTRQALLPLRPQAGPRSHTEHPGGEEKREVPTGWSRLKRHQAWGLRAHAPRGNATTAVQAGLREHGRWLPGAGAPTQPGTTSSRAWISQVPSRGDKLQVTELPTPPPPPRLALPRLQASLLKPTAVSRWGLGTRATLRPHFSGRPPPPKPVTPGTPPPPPKDRGAGRSNPSRRGAPRWARPWGVPGHASSGRSPDRLRPREAGPPHSARRTQAGRQQPSVGGRPAGSPRLLLNGDKGQRARVGGGPCGGAGHGHFRPESAPRSTNRRPLSSRRAASPAGLRTPACSAPVVSRLPGAVVPLPRLACTCRR